jgi:diguanylate cyclase (GGDEF)-like protein
VPSILNNPSAVRTLGAVLAYWLLLLVFSTEALGLVAYPEAALPWIVLLGLPVFTLAGISLWHMASGGPTDLAYHDDLTGIGNRRAFMRRARTLLRHAKPGTRALVLIDIDGLKVLNDSCGHQAGDELLTAVAQRLGLTNRYVYRIGGDEFAILIDRREGDALTASLELLQPFAMTFMTCGHEHKIGFTYGYASVEADEAFESLFRRADIRLGEIKRQLYDTGARSERRRSREPVLEATAGGPTVEPASIRGTISSLEERRRSRAAQTIN